MVFVNYVSLPLCCVRPHKVRAMRMMRFVFGHEQLYITWHMYVIQSNMQIFLQQKRVIDYPFNRILFCSQFPNGKSYQGPFRLYYCSNCNAFLSKTIEVWNCRNRIHGIITYRIVDKISLTHEIIHILPFPTYQEIRRLFCLLFIFHYEKYEKFILIKYQTKRKNVVLLFC